MEGLRGARGGAKMLGGCGLKEARSSVGLEKASGEAEMVSEGAGEPLTELGDGRLSDGAGIS